LQPAVICKLPYLLPWLRIFKQFMDYHNIKQEISE
jgi:hypothetical protein